MKKTFKAMKFNVGNNPGISKAIQKRLFKLGYYWACGRQTVQFTELPYLYTDADGDMRYGDTSPYFEAQAHQGVDIEWMKEPGERKTVEVGGKHYYEDDLAEALSKIKEVE